jgi:polyisoprenoid-binding protein YceI
MFSKRILLSLFIPVGLVVAAGATRMGDAPIADRAINPVAVPTSQTAAVRYVVTASGNEARYRLREKLVGMEIPYDAVGTTPGIKGAIAFDAAGKVIPAESKLTIDATAFKSDKDRRDGYVQRRLLETEKYPTVEFVPTVIRGLPASIPASGARSFEMDGNLTVKGVTRPTTWKVSANFQGDKVTGNAYTGFTFADFEMEKPSVSVILTLADDIRLEYDFVLQRAK